MMLIVKKSVFIVVLLVSTMVLAHKDGQEAGSRPLVEHRSARHLSEEFKLNTEEAVINEYHFKRDLVRQLIGESSWITIQAMALEAIRKRDFKHFDPLVRDTSCELRAIFGVYVAHKIASADGLTEDVKDLATLIYILSNALKTDYGKDGFGARDQNNWRQLLKLLSSQEVDSFVPASRNQVDSLIKELELAVANGSVMFARSLCDELDNATCRALKSLFLRQCIYDSPVRRRPLIPCIGICRLALELSRLRGIPLVTRIRLSDEAIGTPSKGTVVAVHKYSGREFVPVDPQSLSAGTPVLVADGVTTHFATEDAVPPDCSEVESYIAELDYETAWLSGGAAHPQYTGENVDAELTSSPGSEPVVSCYQELVETAERMGTSEANRSMLFIDHCYVTTLDHALRYGGRKIANDHTPKLLRNGLYYLVMVEREQTESANEIARCDEFDEAASMELLSDVQMQSDDSENVALKRVESPISEPIGRSATHAVKPRSLSRVPDSVNSTLSTTGTIDSGERRNWAWANDVYDAGEPMLMYDRDIGVWMPVDSSIVRPPVCVPSQRTLSAVEDSTAMTLTATTATAPTTTVAGARSLLAASIGTTQGVAKAANPICCDEIDVDTHELTDCDESLVGTAGSSQEIVHSFQIPFVPGLVRMAAVGAAYATGLFSSNKFRWHK